MYYVWSWRQAKIWLILHITYGIVIMVYVCSSQVSIEPSDASKSVLKVDKKGEPPGPAQAAFHGLVPGTYLCFFGPASHPSQSLSLTSSRFPIPVIHSRLSLARSLSLSLSLSLSQYTIFFFALYLLSLLPPHSSNPSSLFYQVFGLERLMRYL